MLKWLVDSRLRESWTRYSVAVYLGLLLAGTLSAEPPVPPESEVDVFLPQAGQSWPAFDGSVEPSLGLPLLHVERR